MQESEELFIDTYDSITEIEIESILFTLLPWDRIFLIWDLGSGKSTLVRALLRKHFADPELIVRSPTYTYYQKYSSPNPLIKDIYHFDLYRLESYEDVFLIGALDILENPKNICLIEWPAIISHSISPTRRISITKGIAESRTYTSEIRRK